jgi:5-methyltetrahydropteroyltriglutamate--homocysteine methyltransferase
MKRSTDRILTTHAGSLPRPDDVLAMVQARASGAPVDEAPHRARLRGAVAEIVRRQVEAGIDVVDDGELGKPGFIHYVNERLAGFEPSPAVPAASSWAESREVRAFPEYYAWFARVMPSPAAQAARLACTGPVTYRGQAQLRADLDNLGAAVAGARPAEAFVPAASPSSIAAWHSNRHYGTEEEYLFAIADAMREEYAAIVDAGFLLQIDDPRLVTHYILHPELSLAECRRWCRTRVDALNHALRGIPEDRVRFHTCYSINMGPRVHDMQLRDIVDIILRVRAGAYSFEAANPRHEHEWRVWEDVKLPAGKLLIPGVITQSSVLVEHPELVADRIARFAQVVGRENVIAGSDCGFATFAGSMEIHPTVAWAKLAAMAEGARIASRRLWAPARRRATRTRGRTGIAPGRRAGKRSPRKR